jgi:high-affinity nickel permease
MLKIFLIVYAVVFLANVCMFLAMCIDTARELRRLKVSFKTKKNFFATVGLLLSMLVIFSIPILNFLFLIAMVSQYDKTVEESVDKYLKNHEEVVE